MANDPNSPPVAPGGSGGEGEPAGGTGTVAPPATEVRAPADDRAGGRVAVVTPGGENAGKPLGKSAPTLDELNHKPCPNCTTGVLYVIRYDPEALHEKGQERITYGTPTALPPGYESGGAYEVRCFFCEWTHSFAMNPGPNVGETR